MDTDAVIYRSTDEKSEPKDLYKFLKCRSIEKLDHFGITSINHFLDFL